MRILVSRPPTAPQVIALLILAISLLLYGCQSPEADVVARFKEQALTRKELHQNIPPGSSAADSARFVRIYIDEWIRDQALAHEAQSTMPDLEQKIAAQMEDYRRKMAHAVLLENYVRANLDTLLTPDQLAAYHKEHPAEFASAGYYYQYYHLRVPRAVANPYIAQKLTAATPAQLEELRKWAAGAGYNFKLDSNWADAPTLTKIQAVSGVNLRGVQPKTAAIAFPDLQDPYGTVHYFYMANTLAPGQPLPLELVAGPVADHLLSQRRHKLIQSFEKKILEDAYANNYVKVY